MYARIQKKLRASETPFKLRFAGSPTLNAGLYFLVVLLLLIFCLFLLQLLVEVLCLMLVLLFSTLCRSSLTSYWWVRERWLLCYNCRPDVWWQSVFCGSSSRCRGLVCGVWLWYFLVIRICFFGSLHLWISMGSGPILLRNPIALRFFWGGGSGPPVPLWIQSFLHETLWFILAKWTPIIMI